MNNTKSTKGSNNKPKGRANKTRRSGINYKNTEKMNKNFIYKDLKRSNCYDCDFSNSNFDFTSFRGAHFKSCNFYGASFKAAEFVGTNLKKSRFKKARFEDVVFEGANLDGVDFAGAVFRNTIFVGCDVSGAKNLNTISVNIKIYDEMPALEMSDALEDAIKNAMTNKFIKDSRVLDTKEGNINTISVMRLLDKFDEQIIINGLAEIQKNIKVPFSTLSYMIKFLADYEANHI